MDAQVLAVVLTTFPLVVISFAAIAHVSGIGLPGAVAFGFGCGAFQITSYQITRLKNAGRLTAANAALSFDRAGMVVAFGAISLLWSADITALAFSWLVAQGLAALIVLAMNPPPPPVWPSSLFQFRSGIYVAVTLAGITSAMSLARLPVASHGTEAVGTFVAAGYLALPTLAVGSAIDQLAFLRLSQSQLLHRDHAHTWGGYALLTILATGLVGLFIRMTGPWALAELNPDYVATQALAGPVLAWSISMTVFGLAMKRLYADKQLRRSSQLAIGACTFMVLGIGAPILLGLTLRTACQIFAASAFCAALFAARQAQATGFLDRISILSWVIVVCILNVS